MHPRFQKVYDRLEADRKALMRELQKLSNEQRAARRNGKWSIDQILAHLLTAERLSLVYMKKKSLGVTTLGNSGILEVFKFMLLKISQRIPVLKFKAPKNLVESTPVLSWEDLQTKWDQSRSQLSDFLKAIPAEHVRKKVYKHHIAGRLDAAQGVAFLREHFQHHLPQIKRLIKRHTT